MTAHSCCFCRREWRGHVLAEADACCRQTLDPQALDALAPLASPAREPFGRTIYNPHNLYLSIEVLLHFEIPKGSRTGRYQGCNHVERVGIERFLAAGASIKGAARKFAIDYPPCVGIGGTACGFDPRACTPHSCLSGRRYREYFSPSDAT